MPGFAVVIPLFNKGPHIERAIRSVLAQTVRPKEVIVVDDGSSDGGFEFVQTLGVEGLVLDQRGMPGPGGYAARNRGIELASTEWIAFLDADDEWHSDHLERIALALAAAKDPERVVTLFSGYQDIYADGRHRVDPYTTRVGGGVSEMDFETLIGHWVNLNASPIWTSATVCRRSALVEVGAFPEARCRRGGDKDTWLRVAHLGTAIFSGAVTANYFRDSVNMTTKKGYSNVVPCIVESTKKLASIETGRAASLLRTLQNKEILNYALVSARTTGLERGSWADFDTGLDPMGGAALRFLSTPFGAGAASLGHALKLAIRR